MPGARHSALRRRQHGLHIFSLESFCFSPLEPIGFDHLFATARGLSDARDGASLAPGASAQS